MSEMSFMLFQHIASGVETVYGKEQAENDIPKQDAHDWRQA
ncbi:hypothetical protein [Eubacterium sp. 14-2]|nr:hypothetical protein [Eubacterium sp. 14-2]